MGEVIDFPERGGWPLGEEPNRDFLSLDVGTVIEVTPDSCGGAMHVFPTVPGFCVCGAEQWTREGRLADRDDRDEAVFGIHRVA